MYPELPHRTPLLSHFIDKWAVDTPGKVAVIQAEEGKQWMYRQLAQHIDIFAQRLLQAEVAVGDRVVGTLSDTPEQVALMWACWKVGAVFVPTEVQYFHKNMGYLISHLEPKAFFLSHQAARILHHKGQNLTDPNTAWIIVPKGKFPAPQIQGLQTFRPKRYLSRLNFSKKSYLSTLPKRQKNIHAWSPVLILPPSIDNHRSAPLMLCMDTLFAQMTALNHYLNIDKHNKTLAFHPFESMISLIHQVISPLLMGGTTILTHATRPQEWRSLIGRYHVNTLWMEGKLPKPLIPSPSHFTSLQHVITAHPPYEQVKTAPMKEFHNLLHVNGLFLPETGGIFAIQSPRNPQLFIPQCRVSIRQPMSPSGKDGRECDASKTGILCIHPPMVFSGFLQKNGISTPRVSKDGLYYTDIQAALHQEEGQTYLKVLPSKTTSNQLFAA
ncbi:MAG: class I adenylate-forming enzyme family protein [Bacteroidota bacterium]